MKKKKKNKIIEFFKKIGRKISNIFKPRKKNKKITAEINYQYEGDNEPVVVEKKEHVISDTSTGNIIHDEPTASKSHYDEPVSSSYSSGGEYDYDEDDDYNYTYDDDNDWSVWRKWAMKNQDIILEEYQDAINDEDYYNYLMSHDDFDPYYDTTNRTSMKTVNAMEQAFERQINIPAGMTTHDWLKMVQDKDPDFYDDIKSQMKSYYDQQRAAGLSGEDATKAVSSYFFGS